VIRNLFEAATMGIEILEHKNPECVGVKAEVEDRETMFVLLQN